MRLRKNERCPIHNSYWCCGREAGAMERKRKNRSVNGVTRIEDPHHPRGYREKRSPAAMRELLKRKLEQQKGLCGICGKLIEDVREAVPDHKEPRGMGGGRRDDHESNIQAAHNSCNLEKGSKRTA